MTSDDATNGGRRIRCKGKLLRAPVGGGTAWAKLPIRTEIGHTVRRDLAAVWRENGRVEHASVAAFGKLSLDLLTLGAPPRLLADANEDALDEIRHAELCFSIARSLDGREMSPAAFTDLRRAGPLPKDRVDALAALAVDSLVEGVLFEGAAASILAQLTQRCAEPAIRAALKEIATDEGRHAAHSWEVINWCVSQGGATVVHALQLAADHLPLSMSASARTGDWEKYGIAGTALEAEEFTKARECVVRRVRSLSAPSLAA